MGEQWPDAREPSGVLFTRRFPVWESAERIHVTEKPLQLMKDVIQICEPGGRILDPFAGAGTTILAAVEEGYEAVGIEVTDAYYKLGTDRVQFALNAAAGENDGQNA